MNQPQTPEVLHRLVLADGSQWSISAADAEAASIVAQLGCAMRLPATPGARAAVPHGKCCRLTVRVEARAARAACAVPPVTAQGDVVCVLNAGKLGGGAYPGLVRVALVFAREAQARGGVLMHGALAERDGVGVVLAAPGGTGKTTASNRLPPPWRSLCDDTVLLVRDPQGCYWAHPWPTWSRFVDGGPGGSWDVRRAVPVKAIFLLTRAPADRVQRVGRGQAVSLLVECVKQVSTFMPLGAQSAEVRGLHLEQFNNLCALTLAVPSHLLHISLTGSFWQELEQAL